MLGSSADGLGGWLVCSSVVVVLRTIFAACNRCRGYLRSLRGCSLRLSDARRASLFMAQLLTSPRDFLGWLVGVFLADYCASHNLRNLGVAHLAYEQPTGLFA